MSNPYLFVKQAASVALPLLLATACATTKQAAPRTARPRPKPAAEISKAGTKNGAAAAPGQTEQGTVRPLGPRELEAYVRRLSDKANAFSEQDRKALQAMPPRPAPGSLEEAAIVVGVLRSNINLFDEPATYEEQDLYGDAAGERKPRPTPSDGVPLAEQFDEKGVALDQALQNNRHLRTFEVFQLALAVATSTPNPDGFTERVATVVRSEAERWATLLGGKSGTAEEEATAAEETPAEQTAPQTYSPANLRRADALLQEAEQLAENGRYKDAIGRVKMIDAKDPFYPAAQEKIKVYSNRAVQQLRQKAAQAFQSAMPVSDPASKAAYLEKARHYLEEALATYPQADQLATVRENLAVITRDLKNLGVAPQAEGEDEPEVNEFE